LNLGFNGLGFGKIQHQCAILFAFPLVPLLPVPLKMPLYLHDLRSEFQFGRVEISPSCIAL